MTVRLSIFSGPDIAPTLRDLAQLCTIVFRDWPHLYDGDGRYDPDHLQALAASQRSAVVMAYDGEVPVGAATCLPLEDAAVSYQAPFLARAWPVEKFFYLAEAVLLPEYRGRGIGAAFLAQRETHIRAVSDCEFACFCAIERPANHPARPSNWVPLNAFWRRHGYSPVRGFRSAMRWKEFGRNEESDLTMQVWVKSLGRAVLPAA